MFYGWVAVEVYGFCTCVGTRTHSVWHMSVCVSTVSASHPPLPPSVPPSLSSPSPSSVPQLWLLGILDCYYLWNRLTGRHYRKQGAGGNKPQDCRRREGGSKGVLGRLGDRAGAMGSEEKADKTRRERNSQNTNGEAWAAGRRGAGSQSRSIRSLHVAMATNLLRRCQL